MAMVPPPSPPGQVAAQPATKARPSNTGGAPRRGVQVSGSAASMGIGRPWTCGLRQVTAKILPPSGAISR
jgi:hypothetical protein